MVGPLMDMPAGAALNGIASDSRSLDQLRQAANRDPAKAVKQVAQQFEALFMQSVLKSMRDATPKSGMLDSSDQQMYLGMLDEQLAQKIAAGGTGLAAVIERQLSRNLPAAVPPGAATAATAAAGTATTGAATTGAGNGMAPVAPAGARPGAAMAAAGAAPLLQTLRAAAAVRAGKPAP